MITRRFRHRVDRYAAAVESYDKQRAASRASSVARLRQRAGVAPLTVDVAAAPSHFFFVQGPAGSFAGRYELVATWIEGFVAAWEFAGRPRLPLLPSGQGFDQGDHAEQQDGYPNGRAADSGGDRQE
jgi:hypothetical protein